MNDRVADFLRLVMRQDWRRVPPIWNEQLRSALNDGFITVGWGGAF